MVSMRDELFRLSAYRATLLPIRWALEHDRNPSSVCVTELNPRGTKYPLTLVLAQI